MTISSVYPSSSFFYDEFSFLGETALDVRIEEREKERRRERSRSSIYSTNPQKSLYNCLLVRVYSFFFPSFFFSQGKIGHHCQSARLGREERKKSWRGDEV